MTDSLTERLETLFSTAVSYHQRGEGEKARLIYEQIIQLDPAHSNALHLLGLVAAQNGNFRPAVEWMNKALAIDPGNPAIHSNRGLALFKLGEMAEAVESFNKAIRIDPGFAQAHNNQGLALQALSRPNEAMASFDRAIAVFKDYAEAYYNKGLVLQKLNRFEEAVNCYGRAVEFAPGYADAHYNKGLALKALDRFSDAVASFRACLDLSPESAEVHFNLGVVLQKINHSDAALLGYERAIALKPDFAEAHNNRGRILKDRGQFDEAIACYDRAIALEPGFFEAYSNRGVALLRKNKLLAAVESFNQALALNPDFAEACNNRGLALQADGQLDAAIASYDEALRIKPDFAEANWNKALALLLKGDWAEGWALYRWGFEAGKRGTSKGFQESEWDGRTLKGSLLVLPEQGVGDEIFYSGMVNDLRGLAESTTLAVDPRLVPLFQRSFDHVNVVSSRDLPAVQTHEARIHLASLGRFFRADETGFKRVVSPYLKADAERIQSLRRRIAGDGKLICGLSWASKNKELGEDKSLRLEDLKPLLGLSGVVFVDLQYGDTGAERAALQKSTGIVIKRVPEIDNFNDLDGLAALIGACDVVVTVSNTTAHLAGALGKPLIVMLPCSFRLLWYWHVGRADSPWYPCAKLFRQPSTGNWGPVINAVRDELQRSCLK